MIKSISRYLFSYLACVLAVVSCGGGGGIGSVAGLNPSDISGTGVTVGTVTGFGSIFVNGTEYATDEADFTVNDQPGVEAELKVGQVVTLRVNYNNDGSASAQDVIYDPELRGFLTAIDLAANELTVSGQVVLVDAATIFINSDLVTLIAGEFVEISGYRDADNNVRATYVEHEDAPVITQVELKGTVQTLDSLASTFLLGSLTVDYSAANLDPMSLVLAEGLFVEAKGEIQGTTLVATEVEREDPPDAGEGEALELEGVVQSIVSATEFRISGLNVLIDGATRYENGTAANIQPNVKLEVTGSVDASGKLLATKIEFRAEPSIEVFGFADSTSAAEGTVTLVGVDVFVNELTTYEDELFETNPFGIDDIQPGDWIEVRGYQDGSQVFANRLERDGPEDKVWIQAPIETIDIGQSEITLLGVLVDTSATDYDLNQANVGDLVKAEGAFAAEMLIAESVEPAD